MKQTFLIVTIVMCVTGLAIAQQPVPVKVEGGLVQATPSGCLRGVSFSLL